MSVEWCMVYGGPRGLGYCSTTMHHAPEALTVTIICIYFLSVVNCWHCENTIKFYFLKCLRVSVNVVFCCSLDCWVHFKKIIKKKCYIYKKKMLRSMGMWFTLTRGVMVLYYGLGMLILACHTKKIEKKNHAISWKFIYRPYMVRSLSMPFSLSMGAFNVNFFVWFFLFISR